MPEPRLCPDCGADISTRGRAAKRCEPCAAKRRREKQNRLNRDRYRGDLAFRSWKIAYNAEYRRKPENRERIAASHRKWHHSPRGQATRRAYYRRPEVKARNAKRMREQYTPRPRVTKVAPSSHATPSTLHPDVAGRTVPQRAYQPERPDRKAEYAAAMAAAAEPRQRECCGCGDEAPDSVLGRHGGLCGFCAEIQRRRERRAA